ncbi:hypothetical protein MAA5396_04761 [Marinovum algicola]|uniref:Uncharacterized protein n=2 Tax=Marinovum algicola TaxID=42444 RepID=A0A975ZQQ2_9RHOB|nr:hypothetical protein SAMN04487940_12626 [Marinovum algicola]SLN76576.1 hypothetical protein MAA5396_04761 [Marinovum algicola]
MRSELTPTQMAEHLAKRKELWAARNNANTVREKPGRPKGFAGETSDATGVSARHVQKAVARASGVTEEARDAIRGTDMDKGTVLDELRRVAPERQLDVSEMRQFAR